MGHARGKRFGVFPADEIGCARHEEFLFFPQREVVAGVALGAAQGFAEGAPILAGHLHGGFGEGALPEHLEHVQAVGLRAKILHNPGQFAQLFAGAALEAVPIFRGLFAAQVAGEAVGQAVFRLDEAHGQRVFGADDVDDGGNPDLFNVGQGELFPGADVVQAVQRGLHPHVGRPVLEQGFVDVEGLAKILVQPIPIALVGDVQPVAGVAFQAVVIILEALFCDLGALGAASARDAVGVVVNIAVAVLSHKGGRLICGQRDAGRHLRGVEPQELARRHRRGEHLPVDQPPAPALGQVAVEFRLHRHGDALVYLVGGHDRRDHIPACRVGLLAVGKGCGDRAGRGVTGPGAVFPVQYV